MFEVEVKSNLFYWVIGEVKRADFFLTKRSARVPSLFLARLLAADKQCPCYLFHTQPQLQQPYCFVPCRSASALLVQLPCLLSFRLACSASTLPAQTDDRAFHPCWFVRSAESAAA